MTETEHPASVMPVAPFEIKGEVDRKEYTGIYLNDRANRDACDSGEKEWGSGFDHSGSGN
ncbi:MAG: hypothetical protein ACLR2E_02840 [Lachnospiraceae bacterium]